MSVRSRLCAGLAAPWLITAITACGSTPHLVVPTSTGAQRAALPTLLAAHPLPAGQNISATPLGRTDAVSYHLVQIRDREQPHVHATHDLVVTMLQGSGTLYLRGAPSTMRAGDVAVVARGTPHYFVNTGAAPAAAFVTFAPPYDGTDQVPMEP